MKKSVYQARPSALLRAVPCLRPPVLPWPDLTADSLTAVADCRRWLAAVWRDEETAEAISYASPGLAAQVDALLGACSPSARRVRAVVTSVLRYVLRAGERPTPFGLFAGVAPAGFAASTDVRWGSDHVAVAQPSASWLTAMISKLESHPGVLDRLSVVANSTASVRGDRLVIPHQPAEGLSVVEVSLHRTAAVEAVMEQARSPILVADLAASLHGRFPEAARETVSGMLAALVAHRALISSLHVPATVPDALAYLNMQLRRSGIAEIEDVAELLAQLARVHDVLTDHNRQPASKSRAVRRGLAQQMTVLSPAAADTRPVHGLAARGPLVVDLGLDAATVLPNQVADEVARAGDLLTRLSAFPSGLREWGRYLERFWERYGIGSLVPVTDVVADLGYPDGYLGTGQPLRSATVSGRDEALLALAQEAALDGRDEVVLHDRLLSELDTSDGQLRCPPHLEVGVRVHASTVEALDSGRFRVEVVTVSRGAGTLTGRFLPVLEAGSAAPVTDHFTNLPTVDSATLPVQISFPPLRPADAHLTRTRQVLPDVISLAEFRAPGDHVLTVADLAVGCDGYRLYLAAPAWGRRIEAVAAHALNLQLHTPPLARFLLELGRAQAAQVTPFAWGQAAARLPFLPRLRHGRIVLAQAQWRLTATELPAPDTAFAQWQAEFSRWRERRRLPRRVLIAEKDRRLPLDLDETTHQALLRAHLASADHVRLLEGPAADSAGWCEGHAHELVVTLTATKPHPWPRLPRPTRTRVVNRSHGHMPGGSRRLLVKLHSPSEVHDLLLARHLPDLISRLDQPDWWFLRFRDSDGPHLRIRLCLPGPADAEADPATYGRFAQTINGWATELRRAGLVRHLAFATSYPEVGRWGGGTAYRLAEQVFAADSRTVCDQLAVPDRPSSLILAAAHITAIAVAFNSGAEAGTRWLIDHLPASSPSPIARPDFVEAVRLADPDQDWAAFRAASGGSQITSGWQERARAVAVYRAVLPDVEQPDGDCAGILADQVLRSLLHTHFIRGYGIDRPAEGCALYLARSAAQAWAAVHESQRGTASGRRQPR